MCEGKANLPEEEADLCVALKHQNACRREPQMVQVSIFTLKKPQSYTVLTYFYKSVVRRCVTSISRPTL